jgi:DNA-binding MarR family transcriptional regulator
LHFQLITKVKGRRGRVERWPGKIKPQHPAKTAGAIARRCAKASRRISQLYDTALAPSGVKATQRAILAQIARLEPTNVGKLAEVLVMDSGALVHTLKPPERDGLVAVTLDADDRRNRLITLTRHGRAKLAETDALWAKAQRSFEAGFGRSDSESLREALRFLITDDFGAPFEKVLSAPVREFREEFNDRSQKRHV